MKKLLVLAIVLGLAVVLILTKPTPQEIASAATGQINYISYQQRKNAARFCRHGGRRRLLIQTVEDVFAIGCAWRQSRRAVADHRSRFSDVLGFDGGPCRAP